MTDDGTIPCVARYDTDSLPAAWILTTPARLRLMTRTVTLADRSWQCRRAWPPRRDTVVFRLLDLILGGAALPSGLVLL